MKKERLDKILSNLGVGSRKEIKKLCKEGEIRVDGEVVKDSSHKLDPTESVITVKGEDITYRDYVYLMMNKPKEVVSATYDNLHDTVIDLLDEEFRVFDPFPVGRLDIDTEGLLLISNDGKLSHKLLSPKKKVKKTYYAEVRGKVDRCDIEAFREGVIIDDEYKALPAELEIEESSDISRVKVTIVEGKFHQVKKMFKAVGKEVLYLKRIKMGTLLLDESLELGEYRELTDEELNELLQLVE